MYVYNDKWRSSETNVLPTAGAICGVITERSKLKASLRYTVFVSESIKKKLRGLSPSANYTDRGIAP
jgi:hypothetical protein